MAKTLATMFTGGGLFDTGAIQAGYEHLWGIEYREDIAGVARANGLRVVTADVTDVDPSFYERPYHLHASPPCLSFSVAKAGAEETEEDIAMAEAVCRFLRFHEPHRFTLENVYKYRLSKSFEVITDTLESLGYWFQWKHINAADYGVPQTRRRLILIASREMGWDFPKPTHAKSGRGGLKKWNGWYAAIEDLISTLPESKFAEWQLKRLPRDLCEFMIGGGNTSDVSMEQTWHSKERRVADPVHSISPASGTNGAFLLDGKPSNYEGDLRNVDGGMPTPTITQSIEKHPLRAMIISCGNTGGARLRDDSEPSHTVVATVWDKEGSPRAFLVGDQKGQLNGEEDPSSTIRSFSGGDPPPRAFTTDGRQGIGDGGNLMVADSRSPVWTLAQSSGGGRYRGWLDSGRVVKMTPRALARFQTVPDSYILPAKASLACTVIGNGVPCLLAKILCEE